MAKALLSLIEAGVHPTPAEPAPNLPASPIELNLLLEWPGPRSRPQWAGIFVASLVLHIFFFFVAIQLPSFIQPAEPERTVIVRRTPLYLPPSLLTQRAPNRQKLSKNIDLADLLSAPAEKPRPAARPPSVKRFEVPKQSNLRQVAKNTPQILPEAPQVTATQAAAPSPGALNGLPAPPAPAPSESPFQNVGSEAPENSRHTLAPPKAGVDAAINGLAQDPNSRKLVISDDSSSRATPGSTGTTGPGEQHNAVELESDPQGADFKPYLTRILAIVRANWRRVIPESARLGLLRGRTVIEFVINRDGSIPKLVTADPSGSQPLDQAAVAGLSMSNPLPPLPADYKGLQVRLAFTFSCNMPSR